MRAYELPTSLIIGEVAYSIRPGWRVVLDIFAAMNDPDLDREAVSDVILRLFYPEWITIPGKDIPEAIEKACDFMDCGHKKDDTRRPRLVDWEQDGAIIMPAINSVAGREVRLDPDIHWWTFHGWYMSIEGGLFSSVLRIRQKQSKGKKLDKYEEEFLRENRALVDLQKAQTAEDKKTQEYFSKWL